MGFITLDKQMNTGINTEHRTVLTQALSELLADSYTLYLKTHNYHWNVTGPQFTALHELFEVHYTELATAIDEIAERIRALGAFAPGSYQAFSGLTIISEATEQANAKEMTQDLLSSHEAIAVRIRNHLNSVAFESDHVSGDLMVGRLELHEKTAWMLRSLLD